MTIRNLTSMFAPRSVAVFGASERPGSLGRTVYANIRAAGFEGRVFAVNPKHASVDGTPCYAGVAALPEPPDLAVIATPARAVPGLVADLGAKGTRAAVVLTAGLNDHNGLRQAMLDAAKPNLFRIVGPNSFGLFVPKLGLNASFSHVAPAPGRLALLSQSGALIAAMLDTAAARGIGFSKIVSLGDMADVDVGDCLDLLAGDHETAAILVYLETITNARKFMSAARSAARAKPVIVVKSGRHPAAAKAASTHTGALAGPDRTADAAFRRAGLLRVLTLEELFDAAEVLARYRPVESARLAILTNGGGAGVLAVDALEDLGGDLAVLPEATLAALDGLLPPTWSRANPVDIIGDAGPERWRGAAEALLSEPAVDGLLALCCPTALASADAAATALIKAVAAHRVAHWRPKPVLSVWLGEATVAGARGRLREAGIASLGDPAAGVASFAYLARWSAAQRSLMRMPPAAAADRPPDEAAARAVIAGVAKEGRTVLTEPEAKDVLAAFGIPVVPTTVVSDLRDASRIGAGLLAEHDAIAVKILSRDISHKSDVGGVALGLRSAEVAAAAAREMVKRAETLRPDARIDGVTMQPMVDLKHSHELILGLDRDPIFGPIVMFGAGGTAVEVIADSAVMLPPLDLLLARDLIGQTRISRLLEGYRDRPAADIDAVAIALVRLSALAAMCPAIVSLDINPLVAGPDGAVTLDARITIDPERITIPAPNPDFAIAPYPAHLATRLTTRAGVAVDVRPIRPEDEALYPAFIEKLEQRDVRLRFLAPRKVWSHAMLARLTQIDYDREMAFVALDPATGELWAVARLHADPDRIEAEYAVLVRSDKQGIGLGWTMMQHLIDYARRTEIEVLYGDVLAENDEMLAMCRRLGFAVERNPEMPDMFTVRLALG